MLDMGLAVLLAVMNALCGARSKRHAPSPPAAAPLEHSHDRRAHGSSAALLPAVAGAAASVTVAAPAQGDVDDFLF
jgi:hypothetical protein